MFRVGYNYVDSVTIDRDTFAYNKAQGAGAVSFFNKNIFLLSLHTSKPSTFDQIYVQSITVVMKNSTVMFNTAEGSGGIALQYPSPLSHLSPVPPVHPQIYRHNIDINLTILCLA